MPYMKPTDVMTTAEEEEAALSPKVRAFVDELRALCERHGVQIAVSGYDSLQIWDDGGPTIYSNGLIDRTGRKERLNDD